MCIRSWIGLGHRHRVSSERAPVRGDFPALRPVGKWVVLGLLLAAGPIPPVQAQEASLVAEPESVQMYRVEVVIFEQLQSSGHAEDSERPPLPPAPPEQESVIPGVVIEQAQPIPQAGPADTGAGGELPTADAEPEPLFFEPVDMQDLADVARSLARRPEYRVLAQEAWRQPGFAREQSRAVDLATVERLRSLIADTTAGASTAPSAGVPLPPAASPQAPAEATGPPFEATATLWLGRYLHLAIEVQAATGTGTGHLDESRRMRSGEVHYFDSPRLGAIAVVVPEDLAEPPPEDVQPEGGRPASAGSL